MDTLAYFQVVVAYLQAMMPVTKRDERGSLTLEQVIISAVLSVAAIAAGAAIVAAIVKHQGNIR